MALNKLTKAAIILVPAGMTRVLGLLVQIICHLIVQVAVVLDAADQSMLNWLEKE